MQKQGRKDGPCMQHFCLEKATILQCFWIASLQKMFSVVFLVGNG